MDLLDHFVERHHTALQVEVPSEVREIISGENTTKPLKQLITHVINDVKVFIISQK